MRLKTRAATTTLSLLLLAGSAGAQFQYNAPGGPEEKPASRREALELEVSRARYRVGPLRIAPWATLRNVAYVHPILGTGPQPPADFTATAGVGFRAYLRNGPKVTWSLGVLPEYTWWQKQAERRLLNGRYHLGFHGFFNRFTLEAIAGREQGLQVVTPEVPTLVSARTDSVEILTELELTTSLFAFAASSAAERSSLEEDTGDPRINSLQRLDHRERITRGGLRWQPRQELAVALGFEGTQADFANFAVPRSNSGSAPLALWRYRGRHLGFDGEVAFRSLESRRGAEFVPYHKPTGGAVLMLGNGRALGGSLYVSRNLIYSLTTSYAYLQDDRLGVALQASFGRRSRLRGFVETGTDDYAAFAAGSPARRDDVSSYGGTLDFNVTQELTIGFQAVHSQFRSNLPGNDRTFTTAGLTVNLGEH